MISPEPDTAPSPLPMLRLPEEYDGACLGHTLDPLGPPRWVYSLNKVAGIHKAKHFIVADIDAAESAWNYIKDIAREHGSRTPVFVEDSQGPKIWTPGG